MKTETPRTTARVADIVQNPGLEWTRAEVEQLGEHAFQLERELIKANSLAHRLAMALANLNDDAAKEIAEYQVPDDVRIALEKYEAYAAGSNISSTT